MNIMRCRFCGADIKRDAPNCSSCGAPLQIPSDLKDGDIKKISAFVFAVEKALKAAKKKADAKIAVSFIVLSMIWGFASYIFFTFMQDAMKFAVFTIVLTGFVLFITFGFFVERFERRAMDAIFEKKIRNDINEYLKQTGYTSSDFTVAVGLALDEEAAINAYISDIV